MTSKCPCKQVAATDARPLAVVAVLNLFLLAIIPSAVPAQQEISAFKVTDISGEFAIRYRMDEWTNEYGVVDASFVSAPMWQEELFLQARGFVYHPAFLDWTVGGGPVFVQYGYDSNVAETSGSETLLNFNTELDFLQYRGYPVTLFYRRDHPEVVTGASGRYLAETNDYGVRGILRPPLSPIFMNWEVEHWDSFGSGLGSRTDEDLDRAAVRTSMAYRKSDNVRLRLEWSDRTSNSGSPGLPIQESAIRTLSFDLDGDNRFGTSRQVLVHQSLGWLAQDTIIDDKTEFDNLRYSGNLLWQIADKTRTFTNVNYQDSQRTDSWSKSAGIDAGGVHEFENGLKLSGDVGYDESEAPGFSRNISGIRFSGSYQQNLSFGSLGIGVNTGLSRTEQVSAADRVTIFDERITLVGTNPVPLSRPFVIEGSTTVTNEAKTQTFIEDLDYRLITVGETTTIERLITGNIEDGQTVLVTYDVATGGTVEYDTFTQGLFLNLNLLRYTSIFLNYSDNSNDIINGTPTTPLNDVNRIELGGRLDYPFENGWMAGGEYRHTRQDEDISPFTRNIYGAYAQTGAYWNTNVWFGIQWQTVDYERSTEDVNLVTYRLTITSRLPAGVMLTYSGEASEDDGGSLPREERRHSLRVDWTYRQVLFRLRADKSDTKQGETRRDNSRITAELRRIF